MKRLAKRLRGEQPQDAAPQHPLHPRPFQPYREIEEPDTEARGVAARILEQFMQRKRRGYIYVNNRLEGCAPLTIEVFSRGINRFEATGSGLGDVNPKRFYSASIEANLTVMISGIDSFQ